MYKLNPETLLWELDEQTVFEFNTLKKLLIVLMVGIIFFMFYFNSYAQKTKDTILQQQNEIKCLKSNLEHFQIKSQDSVTEYKDFRKTLPLKLTTQEEKRLHYLYFKYKDLINKHHCPHNLIWYIAYKESNFKVDAKNSKSTATGLFQFILGTWNNMCKRGGMSTAGRQNEAKQVEVMCIYLDYLFEKYKDWRKVHNEYCGGKIVYKLPYYR